MIGQTISHYKILEKLGEGGMGVVYKAHDTKLDRNVALKFLTHYLTSDPVEKERFYHEARAAAALTHQNIAVVHEIGDHDGQIFIAMEYVEGQTLKEIVGAMDVVDPAKGGKSPLLMNKILDIAIQVCEGLTAAHEKGIVHRDIKSDNIMLTPKGQVKIMDFGLAKLKGATKLTKAGSTLGTAAYMSPEQARGEEVDHRSDIFSLGVILYEVLTGRLPFRGEHHAAIIYSLVNETPEPLARYMAKCPDELQRVVDRALAKDQKERYQHIGDMIVDLKKLNITSMKAGNNPKGFSLRNARLWIAGCCLAVVVVIAGYLLMKDQSEPVTLPPTSSVETEWKNSIAVLPFRDFSSKDQEYFCNGMTDAIIGRLAKIQELKIIATTSVMRYRNTDKDIKEIGRELNVATILEGTLQKEKNKIRLSAQLINAENGFHLWADTYDRELNRVFDIQDDISQAIAEALKVTLTAAARALSNENQPKNFEVYEYHLKGMNLVNTYIIYQREEDFNLALTMINKAIAIDSNYASSYTALAWAYQNHLVVTGNEEEESLVLKYAELAYDKNPNSATGNASIGWVHHLNGDQEQAYSHFRRAIALDPNSMGINHTIGQFLINIGLDQVSIRFFQRAIELDPFYLYAQSGQAFAWRNLSNYAKADSLYRKMVELAPNNLTCLKRYSFFLVMMKEYNRAEELLKQAETIKPGDSSVVYYKALLWAAKGDKSMALKFMPSPNDLMYALLNMREEAIQYLRKTIENNQDYRPYHFLVNNPMYDNLRPDPRFQEIVHRKKIFYEDRLKKFGNW